MAFLTIATCQSAIFATKAPEPQRPSNLRPRDFERVTSMRKASLMELRGPAFP
jgi:hypothetical protein